MLGWDLSLRAWRGDRVHHMDVADSPSRRHRKQFPIEEDDIMRLSRALLAIMVLLVQATFAFGYDKIIIRTGQSSGCGQPDPIFHCWAPQTNCGQPIKPTLFTDADFQAACAGPQAVRVNPYSVWLPSLSHDPAANWIDWHQTSCFGDARSVLYCAQFRVTTDCYPVADSIRVYWAVDDF